MVGRKRGSAITFLRLRFCRWWRQSFDCFFQAQKALYAGCAQSFDEAVHGDILRIGVMFGDSAEVLIVFRIKPEDGAALAVHFQTRGFDTHSAFERGRS